ncbi:sorbin and SH3 domain-containing protein 2-like isoform X14 [Gadus macrocephalus]|uniref:sorbin and SH3 domain-containing protein 2-like isoform X14 n=1 Tax=Gadus macrocephalus TaxID=80720 RepID=UPI0028CB3363|nr:sorbin and SH3 domain-containing protein 2-like isoform X14 [Gadus macrocephalus]
MALCSTNSQCSLVRVGWELGSLSSLPLQAIALKVNAGPMFGNALFQLPVEETDHLRSNKSIMDPGVWCPESLWAPGPAPSSLAAKGFRKVQPNLSRRPAAQGNASQSSLPPLSPPAPLRPFTSSPGGRHRGLPLSPSFPPPTTPSSPPSSTSAFGLELRHSRSADHISSDQRSCSPLDHTSTRTRGRDWYRNMYNKIHVVQKADPDSAEAYSSTKGIANKALSSNSPDPGHLPPSPGSGRSSPAAHRDRREDCGRYRAQPRSIFDYEPGASSVLEREQPSLHPSDLSVEDEPWFRFFAELEFGRPPPKKTLDEMLNEDSPVPDTLSSRLSGEDRFIQSPASSSDDYIDWGKSQSSISHSSSCHTANHSPVRSNPTNQGQMWPSAPANSCASPIKSRDSSQPLDPCRAPPVHPDPCRAPRSTSSVFLALERALSGIWEYLREEGEEGEEHEQEEGEEEEGEEDSRGTPLAPERGSSLWAVEHQRTAHSGRGRGPRAGAERTRRAGTNQWELDVGVRCTNSFSNDHTVASYDRQDRREEPGICQEPPKTTFRNSVIPDRKSVAECARVLYNFDAHTSKELSLRKGDVVTITRLVDSNWYEGQLRRAVGIFPVSYVQKICSQPRRPPPPSTPSRSSVLGEAVVRFNFTADTPVELSLCKGEGVVILRKVDQNWYEGCVPGGQRRGIFPVSYVSAPYGQPRWQTPVADSEQREVAVIGKPPRSPIPSRRICHSPPRGPTHSPAPRVQRQAFTQEGLQCGGEAFKVLYNYNPHNEDELELTEGDTIDVMEQCDDGWFVDRRPDCGPLRWSHSESTCRLMKRSSDILSTNSTFGRGLSERRQRWRPWKPLTTTTTRPGGPRRREVAPPRVFPVCVLRDGAEAPRLLPHRGRALLPGARLWARSGGPLAHRLTHRRTAGPQAN